MTLGGMIPNARAKGSRALTPIARYIWFESSFFMCDSDQRQPKRIKKFADGL